MTKDDIRLLYEYDRWANNRILQAVGGLSSEQFTRALGGSFASVRDTLVHIIAGEGGWLEYWKAPSHDATFMASLRARRDALFSPNAFADVAAVQQKWAEVEKAQMEFVEQLSDQTLEKLIPVRTAQVSLAHLMQHVANHSTYHRGQITLMLRQLGAEPMATDFHLFLMETARDAAAGRD